MDRRTANKEWRDVMRGAPDGVPTGRTVHEFAQRVEALAIAACDARHVAALDAAVAAERKRCLALLFNGGAPRSDGLGPLPARWYMVSRDGLSTLCASEQNAREMVADCTRDYPGQAPYQAALLGDVAAERERWRAAASEALRSAMDSAEAAE